jgi:hypothetical protein
MIMIQYFNSILAGNGMEMESGDHFKKNGAIPKSQRSRGYSLKVC